MNSAGRLVRAVVRAGVRRRDHARDAVVQLHQHGRGEHRAHRRRAAAGRARARARRRGDDATPTSQKQIAGAAAGDAGRDPPHQHRRPPARPSGRAADPDPGRAGRAALSFRMLRLPEPIPSGSVEPGIFA